MRAVFYTMCLVIAIEGSLVLGSCKLPENAKSLDWREFNKMNHENWFEILYSANPLDGDGRCYTITEIESTEDGANIEFLEFTEATITGETAPQLIKIHTVASTSKLGHYYWKKDSDSRIWLNRKFANKEEKIAGKEEVDELYKYPHVYVTDYKTYLIEIVCGDKGNKFLSVYSPVQYPTAALMVNIQNTLATFGCNWSGLQLRLTDCHKPGLRNRS